MRILVSILSILIGGCSAARFTCRDEKTRHIAQYDNGTHTCVNGVIKQIATTIATTTLPSSTTESTQSTSTIISPLLKHMCSIVYFGRVKYVNQPTPIYSDLEICFNKLDLKSPTLQGRDKKVNLEIEKDRHRPEPPILHGKYFLNITENPQPTETSSYINVKNDAVYNLAKLRKRAINKLLKLLKLCKSLSC